MAAGVRGQSGAAASSASRCQEIALCNRESPLRAWVFRPGWPGLAERSEPIPRLAPVGFILPPASRADFACTFITLLGGPRISHGETSPVRAQARKLGLTRTSIWRTKNTTHGQIYEPFG